MNLVDDGFIFMVGIEGNNVSDEVKQPLQFTSGFKERGWL